MSAAVQARVRYACQAYVATARGLRASSSCGPEWAARALAGKLFGPGAHVVREEVRCSASAPGRYVLEPAPAEGSA